MPLFVVGIVNISSLNFIPKCLPFKAFISCSLACFIHLTFTFFLICYLVTFFTACNFCLVIICYPSPSSPSFMIPLFILAFPSSLSPKAFSYHSSPLLANLCLCHYYLHFSLLLPSYCSFSGVFPQGSLLSPSPVSWLLVRFLHLVP